ncbi:hypothetical protein O4H54_15520 [Rhodococcus yunnanensis]|nr:hypothetical protein [Rhodococcus yunnanensis]
MSSPSDFTVVSPAVDSRYGLGIGIETAGEAASALTRRAWVVVWADS